MVKRNPGNLLCSENELTAKSHIFAYELGKTHLCVPLLLMRRLDTDHFLKINFFSFSLSLFIAIK